VRMRACQVLTENVCLCVISDRTPGAQHTNVQPDMLKQKHV
jgi:hypothetical protein